MMSTTNEALSTRAKTKDGLYVGQLNIIIKNIYLMECKKKKMRPLGWVPINTSGVLLKREQFGPRDRHARRADDVERQGEGGHLEARKRRLEQTLPSQPSEGSSPAHTWVSDL